MVRVHHTGDSVETEAIKHVDIHVKSEVGEQESEDFVMAVIEEPRVPELMTSSCTFVEILMIGTVKHVDPNLSATKLPAYVPVKDVLAGVRVDDIQKDCHSHLVGFVN